MSAPPTGPQRIDAEIREVLEEAGLRGGDPVAPTAEPDRPDREARGRRRVWPAVAVVVVSAGLRLYHVDRAYDFFIDEVTYTTIARNLATGHGLSLYGQPFYLHPPAGFLVLATGMLLTGTHGQIDQLLLHLRLVTALAGALSCGVAYALVRRTGARRAALATGLILAIDPFVIQYDSQVMLESLAQLAAVTALLGVAVALTSDRSVVSRRALAGAGVAAGLTMATKETFGLVIIATLLVMWATGWVVPRLQAQRLVVTGLGTYLVVTISGALAWGGLGPWFADKFHGVERLVGIAQDTGFNAPTTHVTLTSRITANLGQFGTTYLLLGLGGLATLALLSQLRPWRAGWADATGRERAVLAVTMWSFCACAYLAYAIVLGSLEEQMFYIMVLPVVACLCLWVQRRARTWHRPMRRLAAAALVALLALNLSIWVSVRTTPDDAYEQFLTWERANIRPGTVVSVTEFTAQFLITNAVLGEWASIPEMRAHHVDYVLIVTNLVAQGYGLGTPATLATLERRAPLVFEAHSRGEGELRLYDVRGLTGGSGA